ncbi:MAG: DUF1464 family protein [Archaeoglobaceae archaeon]|nr:DUF1464 family protein [Archaeoglobaceae archaeon]MCX8152678.1 DUF1464 family protein [Archaeoglobaceae archaeon]MDW8013679.1 DUF1464 family protein [Archaeoglobaceae archaeon]
MIRAAGIDSGTKSLDIFAFEEDGKILLDESIPREIITKNPEIVVEKLMEAEETYGKFHAIAVSSGYGIPLKRAQDAKDYEIALATFVSEEDVKRKLRIIGLRRLLMLFRESNFNAYFIPGVIHLPTVPKFRKVNKVDMGTSDKVFSVVLAIKDQAERLNLKLHETSLFLVEIGFAYTSVIAVKKGKIVDAMAGTAGFPSFLGLGFMDSELAYAIANVSEVSKNLLFCGGAADFAGTTDIEEFVKKKGEAYEMFLESVVKDIASLLPSTIPREILLSGRFSRIPDFFKDLREKILDFFKDLGIKVEVVKLKCSAKVAKEAAEGAAVLANGLAGGKYKEIVEVLELRKSEGKIFDHVYLPQKIKEKLKIYESLLV